MQQTKLIESLCLVKQECSQFLSEQIEVPLYKALPNHYDMCCKVKARKQKKSDTLSEIFNKAFESKHYNIRQRAIITYSTPPVLYDSSELFYIFPIDGYKFMYSKEVTNSTRSYKQVIDVLFDRFDNDNDAINIITDLLKFSYSTVLLKEGIDARAEIIFYGIPYYYAIRTDLFPNYAELIVQINNYNTI